MTEIPSSALTFRSRCRLTDMDQPHDPRLRPRADRELAACAAAVLRQDAKLHGEDQVTRIVANMAEFGWTMPCLVAEHGELIAGHGGVLAAAQLGPPRRR